MNNCNKIKNTCTDSTFATCVDYQGALSEHSGITSDCVTVHETTEDIYQMLDDIYGKIEFTNLGESCIVYVGEITLNKVIKKYEDEICALKNKVSQLETQLLCDVSIVGCNFDLGSIVDSCNVPITTFKGLIQAMLDQINANTP